MGQPFPILNRGAPSFLSKFPLKRVGQGGQGVGLGLCTNTPPPKSVPFYFLPQLLIVPQLCPLLSCPLSTSAPFISVANFCSISVSLICSLTGLPPLKKITLFLPPEHLVSYHPILSPSTSHTGFLVSCFLTLSPTFPPFYGGPASLPSNGYQGLPEKPTDTSQCSLSLKHIWDPQSPFFSPPERISADSSSTCLLEAP